MGPYGLTWAYIWAHKGPYRGPYGHQPGPGPNPDWAPTRGDPVFKPHLKGPIKGFLSYYFWNCRIQVRFIKCNIFNKKHKGPYGPQPGPGPNPDWAPTRTGAPNEGHLVPYGPLIDYPIT